MKLNEFQSKQLFSKYGIAIPHGSLVTTIEQIPKGVEDVYVKAQVLFGDRKKAGGIIRARNGAEVTEAVRSLLGKNLKGEEVSAVLVEEGIDAIAEHYLSISFDSAARGPVLSINKIGGSGINEAHVLPINAITGPTLASTTEVLAAAGFLKEEIPLLYEIVQSLWRLVEGEYAVLAEINPLFKTKNATYIAGDAKVILDDEKYNPTERRYIEMNGDIAMMLSGGGASMLLMDALLEAGGTPANYTEYSGNPPAAVVEELTKKVLGKPGLRGCLVAGGAANFTDIYETLSGFLAGLRALPTKPVYPIVIRRDGPRRAEAFDMLRAAGEAEGYDFHLYDADTPMIDAARTAAKLAAAYISI
jgi:succinyl-CoA synthetase beta subunit